MAWSSELRKTDAMPVTAQSLPRQSRGGAPHLGSGRALESAEQVDLVHLAKAREQAPHLLLGGGPQHLGEEYLRELHTTASAAAGAGRMSAEEEQGKGGGLKEREGGGEETRGRVEAGRRRPPHHAPGVGAHVVHDLLLALLQVGVRPAHRHGGARGLCGRSSSSSSGGSTRRRGCA